LLFAILLRDGNCLNCDFFNVVIAGLTRNPLRTRCKYQEIPHQVRYDRHSENHFNQTNHIKITVQTKNQEIKNFLVERCL